MKPYTQIDDMTTAYIEAVYFTETGDCDQPGPNAELTPYFKARAYIECRNFLQAIKDLPEARNFDPKQLGHDLWLTRNGHGTGFWDRPEIYGEDLAEWFSRIAKAMGQTDAEFIDEVTT